MSIPLINILTDDSGKRALEKFLTERDYDKFLLLVRDRVDDQTFVYSHHLGSWSDIDNDNNHDIPFSDTVKLAHERLSEQKLPFDSNTSVSYVVNAYRQMMGTPLSDVTMTKSLFHTVSLHCKLTQDNQKPSVIILNADAVTGKNDIYTFKF